MGDVNDATCTNALMSFTEQVYLLGVAMSLAFLQLTIIWCSREPLERVQCIGIFFAIAFSSEVASLSSNKVCACA
jgi:hypothetical protein